jgi:hypothetical protein
MDRTSQEAKSAMLTSLASRFRVDPGMIEASSFRQMIWQDDCYGIQQDRACNPGSFFGYQLTVTVGDQSYVYNAPVDDPYVVMLVEGPDPEIGLPALSWQWIGGITGCESLLIAPDGTAALGVCGGPHAAHPLHEDVGRLEEWRYFYQRFASFELVGGDYSVSLQGPGLEGALPSWQRAVGAWARIQWEEIQAGQTNVETARAMEVTRPVPQMEGWCDQVIVSVYGRAAVFRHPCVGEGGETPVTLWLDDQIWAQIDGWRASWSRLYDVEMQLQVYGEGTDPVSESDKQRVLSVADEIIARVGAGPVVPVGAVPPAAGATPPTP